jgi:hypothetical protein
MAISQCVKCGNRSFESVAKNPIGFPQQVMFIQCSACGGVVGVQEVRNENLKNNPERIDHEQESIKSSSKNQDIGPSDINAVLKYLYG